MHKNLKLLAVALAVAAFTLSASTPAYAITAAQRVQLLKYQKCLANFLVVDKSLCHL